MKDLYKYHALVERCREDRDNVRVLNRPVIQENRRIREAKNGQPLKSMPYRLNPIAASVLDTETFNKKKLNDRSPEEWLVMVKSIEDEVLQTRVACIVWWDYFGKDERVGDYSDLLDHYLTRRYVEIPLDDLIRGMVAVGYSAHHAIMRLTKAEDSRE